jgi:hypothetical protein
MGKYEPVLLPHLGFVPFDPTANCCVTYCQFPPRTYTNW